MLSLVRNIILILLVATGIVGCGSKKNSNSIEKVEVPPLEDWLGRQRKFKSSNYEPQKYLSSYEINLSTVKGRNLKLKKSENGVVTYDGIKFVNLANVELYHVDPNSMYIIGTIELKAELGWRIKQLTVRIKSGPLTGAEVHLRDKATPESVTEIYQAVYKVPIGLQLEEGPLEFEVICSHVK